MVIKIEHLINGLKRWHCLAILFVLQFVSHVYYLNLPAVGNHVWRQCNTLAVARNYAQEDMNILYPRIDKRYHTNGITGPQFTSYDYTLSVAYKVFGFSQNLHRYLSLIIGVLAIFGIYYLSQYYFKKQFYSFLAGIAFIGIPEFYYHSINAVPDLLALTCMVWGWYFYLKFLDRPGFSIGLLSTVFLSLAGMTKIMFLMPGFIFLGDILAQKRYKTLNFIWICVMGLVVLCFSLGWYYWAKVLTSMNGIYEFVHEIRFIDGGLMKLKTLAVNLFSDLPETWVGYGLLFAFLIGLKVAITTKLKDLRFVGVFVGIVLFYVAMQYQLRIHGYYTLVFAPFVVLLSLFGFIQTKNTKLVKIAIVLILLSPVWAWLRMNRNWQPDNWRVSHALVENQEKVAKLSSLKKRWIVGLDQSGCVDFYYLQAKGFPWYNLEEKSDLFDKFRKDGAEGLITNDTLHAQQYFRELNWQPKNVGNVGEYWWYVF